MTHDSIYFKTPEEWRNWLKVNHDKSYGIWLIYYKKHTGKPRVPYNEAVEEALCYGWIDSTVKRIDDEKYMQKFTPRKPGSKWSDHNKKRVEKMIELGKMDAPGLDAVNIAKKNGKWDQAYTSQLNFDLSDNFLELLQASKAAYEAYSKLSASQKNLYTNWVMSAKKEETRLKRCKEMIILLEKNQKLGMK